jgi:hypothetical protein
VGEDGGRERVAVDEGGGYEAAAPPVATG